MDALQRMVAEFEGELSLLEPAELRRRLEVLDWLDASFPEGLVPVGGAQVYRRAKELAARLEAVNAALYAGIRGEIRRGDGAAALLPWVEAECLGGMGFDWLDELVCGVFQFGEPGGVEEAREAEMVFYQPTPARHIFAMIRLAGVGVGDVFVDLGSGLGHVPLVVSLTTGASCVGIELEAGYVERARECAEGLGLERVSFEAGDVRGADLSEGTVFYLYTPFMGGILRGVLDRLRQEAEGRRIQVCTVGPCTEVVAGEVWLEGGVVGVVGMFVSR